MAAAEAARPACLGRAVANLLALHMPPAAVLRSFHAALPACLRWCAQLTPANLASSPKLVAAVRAAAALAVDAGGQQHLQRDIDPLLALVNKLNVALGKAMLQQPGFRRHPDVHRAVMAGVSLQPGFNAGGGKRLSNHHCIIV